MNLNKFEVMALLRAVGDLIDSNGNDYYAYAYSETGDYVNLAQLQRKLVPLLREVE